MNILSFLKSQFNDWNKSEIIGSVGVVTLIFCCAVYMKDNPIAVISAICGVLYTFIAGKGRVVCYLFGLTGTMCYSYLSYKNGLYGNLVLYLCYYFPMQVYGIFEWRKNLKIKSAEIKKTQLSTNMRLILSIGAFVICILVAFMLHKFNDTNPCMDSITTVLSVLGMYFTVKRLIEQWYMWVIVNAFSFVMWLDVFFHGANVFATVLMWAIYFFLAVYFLYAWTREIQKQA